MLAHYRRLLDELDRVASELTARYGNFLECRPGCHSCCRHDLSVFEVEAASVRSAVRELPAHVRTVVAAQAETVRRQKREGKQVFCPFLVHDCCSIYAVRPVICRTQGLPLIVSTDEGEDAVDFCPVNFSTPGAVAELEVDRLLPLDAVNLKLVATNLSYCRQSGIPDAESGRRTAMSDLILNGNLKN